MRDDPLEDWLAFEPDGLSSKEVAKLQSRMKSDLDRIVNRLDHPPEGKPRSINDLGMLTFNGAVGFAPEDVLRAQEVYQRICDRGGPGTTYVQEDLLELLAGSEDARSVPFWVELVDLKRPYDRFAGQRRTMALAALARLAVHKNEVAAYQALRDLAHHVDPEVRASAIYYLGEAYLAAERPLPEDLIAELNQIATQDVAFPPRFQARELLREAEIPMPMDNPGGAYEFKVTLSWARDFHCVIAVRSEQNLDELHRAIQRALKWDSDHLYAFYMNGKVYDYRYAFACPMDEDNPPWTDEAIIGELGLTLKHKFIYFFDYGDSHEFQVEVAGIRAQAEAGEYPRVIARSGKPPEQYPDPDLD